MGGADLMTYGGKSVKNKELVSTMLEGMDNDDADLVKSVLAAEVRWWGPPSAVALGMPSPIAGSDAVAGMIAAPYDFFQPKSRVWTVHHLVADDDLVAVHANLKATTAAGHPYTNEYHLLVKVAGGVITDVWEHVDTAQFNNTMSGGAASE
jgi:ketosteroid isomerase-like protein